MLDCDFLVGFKVFPNKKLQEYFMITLFMPDYHLQYLVGSLETHTDMQPVPTAAVISPCHQELIVDLAIQKPLDFTYCP